MVTAIFLLAAVHTIVINAKADGTRVFYLGMGEGGNP